MWRLARPTFRLFIGPAIVAALTGLELHRAGAFVAVAGAWLVFAVCIFALSAWGKIQLAQTERRLQTLRRPRASRTR